jgi:hypothetical protein
MRKASKLLVALALWSACGFAHAQTSGSITPPPDVTNIVSIDAHNSILVETQEPQNTNAPREYSLALPQHIYSGGIARAMGGSVIPTEMLVIPQGARNQAATPNGVMGFGGNNFGGGIGFTNGNSGGFQNGFGQDFGNNNFGNSNSGNGNFNSFGRFNAPLPVNNMRQFNQVMGFLDRPIPQAQVGTSFSNGGGFDNRGAGISFGTR